VPNKKKGADGLWERGPLGKVEGTAEKGEYHQPTRWCSSREPKEVSARGGVPLYHSGGETGFGEKRSRKSYLFGGGVIFPKPGTHS